MADSDVYASRDEAGKAILANLRDYGNLEPPGTWGRFYNAGTKSGYRFSCANYLRMEAETRDHPHQDARWYSEEKIEQSHYVLREGAHPVELEYWHGTDNGQGFEGNLRRFYNAEDILGLPEEQEIQEGSRDSDREYAYGLLHDSGMDMEGVPLVDEALFDAMYSYAQEKGLNTYSAKLSAQLFCKTCRLDHDYQNQPLFTDEELRRIESNPKILFYSMKQANNLLQEMEDRERRNQREAQRSASVRETEPHVPFAGLAATYLYSSLPLKDFSGKPYECGDFLEGEKAYELLVQLNAADKEAFDRIQHGENIKDYTEIYLTCGKYDHGAVTLKLGTLELRNKQNVQEAFSHKLSNFRKELLADAELREGYLRLHSVVAPPMSESKLIETCRKRSNECSKALNRLKWEEQAYLKEHPEIAKINQRQANVYRYVCDAEKAGALMEFPRDFVLSVKEAGDDSGLVIDHLDYRHSSTPELRQLNRVSEGSYVIETAKMPEDLLRDGYGDQLQMCFTQEQAKALAALDGFAVRIENRGSIEHPYDRPVTEEYRGMAAVEHFLREKRDDADWCRKCSESNGFRRGDCKEMRFSYHGEEYASLRYEVGRGQLAEQCPAGIPKFPREQEDAGLREAIYQQFRYQGKHSGSIHELMQEPELSRPDMEHLREEARAQRPDNKATGEHLYAYYAAVALRDYANDTPEKFQQSVAALMQEDGVSKRNMEQVFKANNKFDRKILQEAKEQPTKEPSAKRKPKACIKESLQRRTKERQNSRQREKSI